MLTGHWRYAHINTIRAGGINPALLGMKKVVSEGSARWGLKAMDEDSSGEWLKKHLKASYEPLLEEPWVFDVDTTVKPLHGHQEEAKVSYDPANGQAVRRTPITVASGRIFGCCWTWRCSRAIIRRRRLRNRSCGTSWTD